MLSHIPSEGNPKKSAERDLHVRLLDVNDNMPKLTQTQTSICTKNLKPILITAQDPDSNPFSQPFTFAFATKTGKSPNWELNQIDGTPTSVK